MHWVIVPYLNRSMVVDSLPKLHNLLTIVAQRENVPGLRVAIFHLVHRFISAFVKVFSLIYRFTICDAATPLSLGRPWQPSQDCVLVQTVPHCSKDSASSPSVEPVTQNARSNSHMTLATPRPLIVLTQHSSCHVPPIFRTAKLPERTGSSLTKYQESPQTARLTCSKVGQRACSRSGQTWEEACPASFLPLFSPPCSHSPPCKTHDSVPGCWV